MDTHIKVWPNLMQSHAVEIKIPENQEKAPNLGMFPRKQALWSEEHGHGCPVKLSQTPKI